MTSNEDIGLRKIENFVRSKSHLEDVWKMKERKLISENLVRNLNLKFKI